MRGSRAQTATPVDTGGPHDRFEWLHCLPFVALHLSCLGVLWVGWSVPAVAFAILAYAGRMFAVTGFMHRYFSHRTFKTSRAAQALFAVAADTAAQRGPLWWAAHHRKHHRCSDRDGDVHSPRRRGFWHAHMGWFWMSSAIPTDYAAVRDLARFPELRLLDRFAVVPAVCFAGACYALGEGLQAVRPQWGCDGWQMVVWGFAVSTVAVCHATYTINSLAHGTGRRRFDTGDDSRNSLLLALVTLGEGWHNNHHHYPHSARQGFRWWEIDVSWYLLRAMAALGIIWDLRPVPARLLRDASKEAR